MEITTEISGSIVWATEMVKALEGRPVSEARDCVVRALAIAADVPYLLVHDLLQQAGRRRGCRTRRQHSAAVASELGLKRYAVNMTLHRFLDDARYVPRLAAFTRGHAFGMVRGEVIDVEPAGKPRSIVQFYYSKG